MKIKLPKELVGTVFPKVFAVELNGIDMDIFLPSLYFKILGEGKHRVKRPNEAQEIARYIDNLAQHHTMQGTSTAEGRRIIERLVRTSLIKTGAVGRAKKGEQILAVAPFSILAAKPGFPTENRRQRGADSFLYFALKRQSLGRNLREFFRTFFGRGVKLSAAPQIGGSYDGVTDLDILSFLTIIFLDGFKETSVALKGDTDIPPACPRQERELADDLVKYLFAYSERMPTQALVVYLKSLINLELFIYSLRLVYAINALVRDPSMLPPAMGEDAVAIPPEIYLDFTGQVDGLSHQMAAEAVRRDIEAYQQFFATNLCLRQLDKYAEKLRGSTHTKARASQMLPSKPYGPTYLQAILNLVEDPILRSKIEMYAYDDYEKILKANLNTDAEGHDEEDLQRRLDQMTTTATSDLDKLVILLDLGQRGKILGKYMQWFASVGGINRNDGILRGVQRNRRSWRYAPSNDLLAVLVQLAAVRLAPPNAEADQKVVAELGLREFLTFLETRFGIIVDRPPQRVTGAEYHAAARDNLRAMLARLRQMGMFTDLSDDFTAQRLQPPYAKSRV
ncbi:hypothetical protein [Candidatus Chloroploca sp. Khr17]|uniref:methylation-associated defense system protein MAD7 n=1 Tax=Candidatus Chloroploca sp. Khr17 TaxID=2496869 RepID=UPI00101D81E3|nr:hypothetical protein [Candidatus Chloroploca sp. Khr17]